MTPPVRRTGHGTDAAGLDVREISVPVEGASIRTRLYRRTGSPGTAALLWMHGGGFVGGSVTMPEADAVSRAFAVAGVPVLSVGYRLVPPRSRARTWRGAPAVRYPTPVLDCLAAWRRLAGEADRLGVPAGRVFVGGASAGGNLAVMTALRAAAAGLPAPAGVLLGYPLLHGTWPPSRPAGPGRRDRLRQAFTRRRVAWMARCFVGDGADPARLAEAFPRPGDLPGFPPTVIVTGDRDALRPSGEAFADDLRRHDVDVVIRAESGTSHGHLNQPGTAPFEATMETFTAWLRARG